MRALLDANILLRTLLPSTNPTRAVALILEAGLTGRYTLLLTPELLAEVIDKAQSKPYLAARIGRERAQAFTGLLKQRGELLPNLIGQFPPVGCDPDDDYLLSYAVAGRADYLVSSDDDLLSLGQINSVRIVSPGQFVHILRQEGHV